MRSVSIKTRLFPLAGALAMVALAAAVAASSEAQSGSMHNCPSAGKWSIAVWDGDSGATADDALATCGAGTVAAAYSLDSHTGAWSRWFAGKPDVSNLPPLNDRQGLLALGGVVAAAGAEPLAAPPAANQMQNCPAAGEWSIAVWDGDSGATADDTLATCGVGTVAAAYSLDAQTGGWSRWFAGKPDVSNLPPLNGMQGILALGATPTPTPAPTPAPTADLTAREISDEELADMTIPVAELGSAYADFVGWGQFSGFLTNADIQDKAEADDVQRFGRVNGYRYTYSTLDVLLGKTTEGVLSIGTNVTMYEEPPGASGDLKDEIQERRSRVGTTNSEGLTWRDVQEFDPGPIADESAGLVETVSGQELTYHTTTVWCRRGRPLAFIAIVRFDDENVREEAAALARKLDERILSVLQGD